MVYNVCSRLDNVLFRPIDPLHVLLVVENGAKMLLCSFPAPFHFRFLAVSLLLSACRNALISAFVAARAGVRPARLGSAAGILRVYAHPPIMS